MLGKVTLSAALAALALLGSTSVAVADTPPSEGTQTGGVTQHPPRCC